MSQVGNDFSLAQRCCSFVLGGVLMIGTNKVTFAYVDPESGELMKFRCSQDNVDAARRVFPFLKYVEQEKCLKELQVKRQRLVKTQSLQERSVREELRRTELALRQCVDENFTFEKLENDGKICKEEIDLNFVCGIEDLDQEPFSGISMAQAKILAETARECAQSKLYRKKYPEDTEWRANRVVSSLVDDLLQKNADSVRREIVSLAKQLGYAKAHSLPHTEQRDAQRRGYSGEYSSERGEQHEMWEGTAPREDFYCADRGVASSPECGRGMNRVYTRVNSVGIDPQIEDARGDAHGYDLPPEMPDADSDDLPDSQEPRGIAAEVQECADELITRVTAFVRSELFEFSEDEEPRTCLQELSQKFLWEKAKSKRTYKREKGKKTITELFHAYVDRSFNVKSDDIKKAMSGSEDVSLEQFSKAIRSITRVKVRNDPNGGREFVVRVRNGEGGGFEDAVTLTIRDDEIDDNIP
ncbi:MAG: hypothetical protein LBB15_01080 [Puniceicoccales bacterium]|nr:hypothetical protein [Puniceicoccales bacterium]